MPQAQIKINTVPGSNDDLPINALVQLDNTNVGGELTYAWSILDQPPGTADALSSATIQNPTFTPKKEGTYLLKLVVNQGDPVNERTDIKIAAVRDLKTRERVPASGEKLEGDAARGWAKPVGNLLQNVLGRLADPGIVVGQAGAAGFTAGTLVYASGAAVIKSGLPGQETVPIFSKALANNESHARQRLFVVISGVDGGGAPGSGSLIKARAFGAVRGQTGSPAVFDPVYLSDTGTITLTPGTFSRLLGRVTNAGAGSYDLWMDDSEEWETSVQLRDSGAGLSPANAVRVRSNTGKLQVSQSGGAYVSIMDALSAPVLTQGSDATFTAERDITSIGTTLAFIANATTVVPLAARRFSAGSTADIFQTQDQTGASLNAFLVGGELDMISHRVLRVANAVSGTDALNKGQADGLYAAIAALSAPVLTNGADATFSAEVNVQSIGTTLKFVSNGAAVTPFAVKAAASPSVNVFEVEDSTNAAQWAINSSFQMDAKSHKIINVTDPTVAQDGATKNYVDTTTSPYQIQFSAGSPSADTTTRFLTPGWDNATGTTEIKVRMAFAGKMQNLELRNTTGPTTSGYVVTVRKNGVDTALTATMAAGGNSTQDLTHSFTFAQGDDIAFKYVGVAGITAGGANLVATAQVTTA